MGAKSVRIRGSAAFSIGDNFYGASPIKGIIRGIIEHLKRNHGVGDSDDFREDNLECDYLGDQIISMWLSRFCAEDWPSQMKFFAVKRKLLILFAIAISSVMSFGHDHEDGTEGLTKKRKLKLLEKPTIVS